MSWDAGFSGGLQNFPPPEPGMDIWEYLGALAMAGVAVYARQAIEVLGKEIGDDETGWKAIVRDLAKLLAGYRRNKEHKGDTESRPAYLGEPREPKE